MKARIWLASASSREHRRTKDTITAPTLIPHQHPSDPRVNVTLFNKFLTVATTARIGGIDVPPSSNIANGRGVPCFAFCCSA
jgi:hypothetical protein